MSLTNRTNDNWIQVAETLGTLHAEIIAGLLKSAKIPVYIDVPTLSSIYFGQLTGSVRIFVPEEFYEVAMVLLEEDDEPDLPALDEPDIIL